MNDEQKVWEAFNAWHEMPEHDSGPRDAWEAWKAAWQAAFSHASATAEEGSVVGTALSDEAVASFVEESAKIISGAPFPSARSYAKAREIADLAIKAIDQAIAAKRGG